MPPRSKISTFPDEIKELIQELLRNGKSINSITEKLRELDYDVSKSSVGRYTKKLSEVIGRYKEIHQFAAAMGSRLEDQSSGEIARMNAQLLQGSLFKIMMGDGENEVTLDAKEAMQLASSLEKLSKAQKLDADRELKIREEVRKEALKEATEIVETTVKEKGLSADMVKELKEKFLGVKLDD
ncbi:MAG: hypothetical protein CBB87_08130 [Micavibrio sp. TMED27]|nr:hypothetical protein [Micavibrio sp.]OUT90638.1 MAG: hypothetical protein CBB87_08130 [Micavibrio sp. TMED27]|tara:strand:- start:110 stop:658 length:549 start_codon:yes stop_codon:yes gene_type:complete